MQHDIEDISVRERRKEPVYLFLQKLDKFLHENTDPRMYDLHGELHDAAYAYVNIPYPATLRPAAPAGVEGLVDALIASDNYGKTSIGEQKMARAALLDAIAAKDAEIERLREIQWGHGNGRCNECGGLDPGRYSEDDPYIALRRGHRPGCRFTVAIADDLTVGQSVEKIGGDYTFAGTVVAAFDKIHDLRDLPPLLTEAGSVASHEEALMRDKVACLECVKGEARAVAAETALAAMTERANVTTELMNDLTERCRVLSEGLKQIRDRNKIYQHSDIEFSYATELQELDGEWAEIAIEALRRAAAVLPAEQEGSGD